MITTSKINTPKLFEKLLSFLPQHIENERKISIHKVLFLLNFVSNNGGFFAGGYVKDLKSILTVQQQEKMVPFDLYNIVIRLTPDEYSTKYSPDVDVFFESREQYEFCKKNFSFLEHKRSVANNADEFLLETKRIQFIDVIFGTPEEILNSFDLLASKVAMTNTTLYEDSRRQDFEDKGILHVDLWSSPHTISRMSKYSSRGYSHISDQTRQDLILMAQNYATLCKNNEVNNLSINKYAIHLFNVINVSKDDFSIQELLEFTPLNMPFSDKSYSTMNDFRDKVIEILMTKTQNNLKKKNELSNQ